jgi:hypothetical protein
VVSRGTRSGGGLYELDIGVQVVPRQDVRKVRSVAS